ncbi:hypothetical protein D3C87_2034000 [compost metagenome]
MLFAVQFALIAHGVGVNQVIRKKRIGVDHLHDLIDLIHEVLFTSFEFFSIKEVGFFSE